MEEKGGVTIDSDGIKIEFELADVKERFEGEDICFGTNTPMGEIDEVISFDGEIMDARVIVKYPDEETREVVINIDSDLGGGIARGLWLLLAGMLRSVRT